MASKIPAICKNPVATAIQKSRWALPPPMIERRNAVLDFWFGKDKWAPNPETGALSTEVKPNFELWFGGSPELDKEITEKFKADVEKAIRGEYHQWTHEGPYSLLALVILLDQYSLNIYRDLPEGYRASEIAIPLAYTAIAREWIDKVPENCRMFFTLPLMHSELIDDQTFNKNRNPEDNFVDVHYKAVADHGRFPGRNKVFGRESTTAELEYFKNGGEF
jgi:uncharacterized protein (DUF924 family)